MRKWLRPFVLSLACFTAVPALASGIPGAPPPFDKGQVKLALVAYLTAGDFFQAFQRGVERQAKAVGAELRVFDARQDAVRQREQLEQAIDLGVDGILVGLGLPETLRDTVAKAQAKGIKVVAFDVDLQVPGVTQVVQDHRQLARLVLGQALKDNGEHFQAGVAYVPGFTPMEQRFEIWEALKRDHPGIVEQARFGSMTAPIPNSIANAAGAVLRAHPDISVFFAPYDEFAKGVKLAVDEAGRNKTTRIYSADISTADIQAMTEPDSAWVASAAVNAETAGAISLRTLARRLTGEEQGDQVLVPPTLITRQQLLDLQVRNLKQLAEKLPAFRDDGQVAGSAWIPLPR